MAYVKSFIKWAGGKEKELPIILSNLPDKFERYIEPFVGGGSVYLNINCDKSIINDKSDELILLYNMIKNNNQKFIKKLKEINKNWILLEKIVENNSKELLSLYKNYSKQVNKEKINKRIKVNYSDKIYEFVLEHSEEFNGLLSEHFNIKIDNFLSEVNTHYLVIIFNRVCFAKKVLVKSTKSGIILFSASAQKLVNSKLFDVFT